MGEAALILVAATSDAHGDGLAMTSDQERPLWKDHSPMPPQTRRKQDRSDQIRWRRRQAPLAMRLTRIQFRHEVTAHQAPSDRQLNLQAQHPLPPVGPAQ